MSLLIGWCPHTVFSDCMEFIPYWLSHSLNISVVRRILKGKKAISSKTICLKRGDWLPIFVGIELKCKILKTHYHFAFPRGHFMGKIANPPACRTRLPGSVIPAPTTVPECIQVKEKDKRVQEPCGPSCLLCGLFSQSSLNNFLSFNHHRTHIPGQGKHHVPCPFCNLYRL